MPGSRNSTARAFYCFHAVFQRVKTIGLLLELLIIKEEFFLTIYQGNYLNKLLSKNVLVIDDLIHSRIFTARYAQRKK